LASDPRLAFPEWRYWTQKLQARFFAGDYASAVDASRNVRRLLGVASSLEAPEAHFYGALSHAASCDRASPVECRQHLEALAEHQRELRAYADRRLATVQSRAELVNAEIARVEGRTLDAERLYEAAIESARENEFVQNEALANELAARFYAGRGLHTIAHAYLRNARYGYLRWGADGKVRQLDDVYPHLKEEAAVGPTGTIAASLEHLDLATVIKVSQAVSAEMVLEKLLDTMMRAAIEHAGAERALLVLSGEADHRLAAEATSSNETVTVRVSDEPVDGSMLPETVLRYVLHTRESVVLNDAAIVNLFSGDSYIAQRHARSVLCVPLTTQAKLIGVLYFENNLAPRVFAPARIAVLKLLASQAAVSLDNARLYRDLDEREREARLIVNTIPGLVASLTPAGEVEVVNDQLFEYCGQPLEAMRQWGTNGTVHKEDLPRVAEVFTRGIASGEPYEVEGRIRRFDGVYRWFQIRGLPLRDTRGQVVRWYSLLSDVDDRKRAEVELRRAYDSFVDAQRLSKTGSFIADIVGDDNRFSEEAYRIFELDPATKVTVQRIREVIHPDDLAGWDAMIERAMSGADVTFAYRIVTTRGAVKHVRGVAHVREQMAGRPLFVGAIQDVTESVVAEEALNRARSELAHVTRLTTMGELTASIAHEVKQPIAAAVTSAQTALRWLQAQPPELGEVREALTRIVRAGKRAGDVIGRIRALVTKAPPRKDWVEINAAIREIVELTRGEAAKNRVSVRTVLAEGLPLIQGDRVQLQQVILNLIINGIEAMAGVGEVSRDLLISARKGDAEEVLVAVADTGPGLAAGAQEQMFAAFYTTKPGGLGLGLSICRSIIEAHDGRLWASANDRGGAVFQFTLPAPPR
jgi:PAS domain S-box-containing protein